MSKISRNGRERRLFWSESALKKVIMLSATDCGTQKPNMSSMGQQTSNIVAESLIKDRGDHCSDR